ncbi:MAG: aminoacyl-histidine dipeptidase [Ruminococcaceae bacterium]|nr:aminoacyl-histidine dipeptidase [Oscillospiraceae bacterium]
MAVLSGLQPERVFSYFEKLCSVPHGSGNTKQISDLLVGFAKELGLKYRQDEINNVIIWKDASPGYENAEPIMMQGHMDMVCAKTEDCTKDMTKEGLDVETDGEFVWAKQTSLGGDDCIGVAMTLAILSDDSLPHPPLEAVFTVDEEVGMDGAAGLDCSDLKSRKLLNLDCGGEGIFTVSCAGGVRADCFLPGTAEPIGTEACYSVTISGLRGGHSGGEINKGRGSANVLMARVLYGALDALGIVRLHDVRGGKFDNVICSYCEAKVAVPADKAEAFESFLREYDAILKDEYAASDADVTLSFEKSAFSTAMNEKDSAVMLRTLFAMPHGVQEMSRDFDGLVQTSLNLGMISMADDGLHFSFSIRSSVASQKAMMLQKLRAILGLAGGSVTEHSAYPGWQYRRESSFRDLVMQTWKDQTGTDGRIVAIHGGLECGLFIEKMPGLDVVALGPNQTGIHSVNEKLNVASVGRVYPVLCEILRRSK